MATLTAAPATPRGTLSPQVYKDTEDLIEYYLHRPQFKETFDFLIKEHQTQATFRYRPLKFYISVLAQVEPKYKNDVRYEISPDRTHTIFEEFYNKRRDRETLEHLERAIQPSEVSPEFNQRVEQAESQAQEPQQKFLLFAEIAEKEAPESKSPPALERDPAAIEQDELKLDQAVVMDEAQSIFKQNAQAPLTTPETVTHLPYPTHIPSTPPVVLPGRKAALPKVHIPSFIKNWFSRVQIFIAQKLITPYLVGGALGVLGGFGIGGPIGGVIGGLGGAWLANKAVNGGNSTTNEDRMPPLYGSPSNPLDLLSPLKSSLPFSNRSSQGIAKQAGKQLAKKAINQVEKKVAVALVANPYFWIVIGILAFLLILPILLNLLKTNSLFPPTQTITSNEPPPGSGEVSLLTCSLTSVSSQIKIGNPDLANFITDTANKVGIPPSVLAGVLALENGGELSNPDPNFFNNDYDSSSSNTNQAFGFAQFRPETFDGIFWAHQSDINQLFGLNKVNDDINPQDHSTDTSLMRITSIRDSIILAAFKIKDNKASAVGPSSAWDTTAVNAVGRAYQGSCTVNNYCSNLVNTFLSCNPGTGLAEGPTPPPVSGNLEQTIQSEFGVDFKSLGDTQLQWAREFLWAASNTNFDSLVKGATVVGTDHDLSDQIGCAGTTSVELDRYESNATDPNYFKFLLSHELGHYIRNCHPGLSDFVAQHSAFDTEGGISYYARNASCTGSDGYSEDYADMIAYYLNPNAGYSSLYGCGAPQHPKNPYTTGDYPLHQKVANTVLGTYP